MYRGKEYEKIAEFIVRLQSQYPSAQVGNEIQTEQLKINLCVLVLKTTDRSSGK